MDAIHQAFLRRQFEEGMALASESDVLTLLPIPDGVMQAIAMGEPPPQILDLSAPPSRYVAEYRCKGLVRTATGEIEEADQFGVGIWFPPNYGTDASAFTVLSWLGPRNAWHPNVSDHGPFICIGRLAPSTPLVDILYQVFEIITYQKVTMREDDALNKAACAWARRNQHRFPVDSRPLKRRSCDVAVEGLEEQP